MSSDTEDLSQKCSVSYKVKHAQFVFNSSDFIDRGFNSDDHHSCQALKCYVNFVLSIQITSGIRRIHTHNRNGEKSEIMGDK